MSLIALTALAKGVPAAAKLMDRAKKYKQAPAEMTYTVQLLAALVDPLHVASALASRHESLALVGAALSLADSCVRQCSVLINEPPDSDSHEAWGDWLNRGVQGVTAFERLRRVQTQITNAISALHLALVSCQCSLPPKFATSPFCYTPAAFAAAEGALQTFEMRRTHVLDLCGGQLWRRGLHAACSGSVDAMTLLVSAASVRLQRGGTLQAEAAAAAAATADASDDEDEDEEDEEDEEEEEEEEEEAPARVSGRRASLGRTSASGSRGRPSPDRPPRDDVLYLRLAPAGPSGAAAEGEEEEAEEEERLVRLDGGRTRVRRAWSQEYAAELPRSHGANFLSVVGEGVICYELKKERQPAAAAVGGAATSDDSLLLCYRHSGSGSVSAECFEALCFMALSTRPEAGVSLAHVYDSDHPKKNASFLSAFQAHVGTLQGAPAVAPVEVDLELSTPMRGLGLDRAGQAQAQPPAQLGSGGETPAATPTIGSRRASRSARLPRT